ncbi:polygalacturonase, partial [Genlisea aurea]
FQNLSFNFLKNSVITDVTTKDSKNFHVNCIGSSNVTFQRFTVSAPGESVNTDGLHLALGNDIRVLDSIIKTGDDCVSIGDGSVNFRIQNVTCGPGHGVSIGSLGKNPKEKDINGIWVLKSTFIGTQNGVRIKTWPSAPATIRVSNLHFEDLTMQNVSNPIIIDQEYCPYNHCKLDKPSLIQISGVTISNIKGTSYSESAVTLACSGLKPCQGVQVSNVDLRYTGTRGKLTSVCKNVKPVSKGT